MSNVKPAALILVSLTLISCASGTPRTVVIPEQVPVPTEQEWLIGCPALPVLEGNKPSDVLRNHVKVAAAYHKCAARHGELSEAVRRFNASALQSNN